jgi:hypothetical protein
MVSKPIGLLSLHLFMKQAVGPGWALVGDSGLHIDPTPGLGIADAVRDAVALSEAILEGTERAMALYWRRRDAESVGLYHFADDMGSGEYNNPMTRMLFRRAQSNPIMQQRVYRMMTREIRPQEMIPRHKVLSWLVAESFAGNFAPWSSFGRTARIGSTIDRQQAVVDRALAKVERGDLEPAIPTLN